MISAQTIVIVVVALLVGWQWSRVAAVGSGSDGIDGSRDLPLLIRRLRSAITLSLIVAGLFVAAKILGDLGVNTSETDLGSFQ